MSEEGGGILSGDAVERGSERLSKSLDGACSDPAEIGLHLCPPRFDRAEVRTKPCPQRADRYRVLLTKVPPLPELDGTHPENSALQKQENTDIRVTGNPGYTGNPRRHSPRERQFECSPNRHRLVPGLGGKGVTCRFV